MDRDIPRCKVRYTPCAAKCARGSFSRKRGYQINVYIRDPGHFCNLICTVEIVRAVAAPDRAENIVIERLCIHTYSRYLVILKDGKLFPRYGIRTSGLDREFRKSISAE